MIKFFFLTTALLLNFHLGSAQTSKMKLSNKSDSSPMMITSGALLELESQNSGLLISRLSLTSTTSASPLPSFVEGMIVYNTALSNDVTPGLYVVNEGIWKRVATQTALGTIDFYTKEVIKVPSGTTSQRPTPPELGMLRFNTTLNKFEGFNGSVWVEL